MHIQTFNNGTGVIFGDDIKRICAKADGVLTICGTNISVTKETPSVLPVLGYGSTGRYPAIFSPSDSETIYDLGYITISKGRIVPVSDVEAKIAELQSRADEDDREISLLKQKIEELSNIFDTNSLNFLIK